MTCINIIYIPISEQEKGLERVQNSIDSLKKFGYDYEFVSSPGYAKKGLEHHRQIMANRNKIFKIALDAGEKYICSQESSVIHLVDDNIEVMEEYLDDNPKCGGVFVNPLKRDFPGKAPYRKVALFMVRSELVEGFELSPEVHGCECQQLPNHIREQGYTADWLERKPGRILKP